MHKQPKVVYKTHGSRLICAVFDPDFVSVAQRRKIYGKAKLREFMHRGQRESFRKEIQQLEAKGKRFDPELSYRKRASKLQRVQPQRLAQSPDMNHSYPLLA